MTTCNCCGSDRWGDMGVRQNIKCLECGSLERTRILKMFLEKFEAIRPGIKVLHFAPEKPIYDLFSQVSGISYQPVDLFPELFKFGDIGRFDICEEIASLPTDEYDLIIHSHVMEHIPCSLAAVLFHLQRALRPDGLHLMCVPIMAGCYAEDFGPLSKEEARTKYGQEDHVRRIGREDIARTLGMVVRLPPTYDLEDYLDAELLDRHNIPPVLRKGFTGNSVFPLVKTDLMLVG